MRCREAWLIAGAALSASFAQAATLDAGGVCDESESMRRQIETLLNRPFDAVADWAFVVRVEQTGAHAYELRLSSREAGGEPRERTIRGTTCVEVSEAAAVAIAMMIRDSPSEGAEPPSTAARPVAESPRPELAAAEPRPASPTSGAERGQPIRVQSTTAPFVGLGALVDAGTLPAPSAGPAIHFGLEHDRLRVFFGAAALPSSTAERSSGAGAEFSLLMGEARACFGAIPGVPAFGCAGYEAGRMAGEGIRVSDPRLGATFFHALPVEFGIELDLTARLRAFMRGGPTFPLERRSFELDGEPIHRPAAVAWRLRLELEYFP